MQVQRVVTLLPCHSLEDFPTYLTDAEADSLFTSWTAAWNLDLLAAVGKAPDWDRADEPAAATAGTLYLAGATARELIPTAWRESLPAADAALIEVDDMRQAEATILSLMESPRVDENAELRVGLYALAFAALQMELLTRRMRYVSNVDSAAVERSALATAKAAAEGGVEEARMQLTKGFDALSSARDVFYGVSSYLLDLTLVADSTLGDALERQLQDPAPLNLLISGELIERIGKHSPSILKSLQTKIHDDQLSVIGGEFYERENSLLPAESILWNFRRGWNSFPEWLDVEPSIYGRRRYGLTPLLPQVLYKFGYRGAYHVTLDDGAFPTPGQCHSRWEGNDATAVDALFRIPQDAALAGSLLCFAENMGCTMDLDHVAVLGFAHWPAATDYWYDLLKRTHRLQPVLGEFVTLEKFFEQTENPGYLAALQPDDYEPPYWEQDVALGRADAISRYVVLHELRSMLEATAAVQLMTSAGGAKKKSNADNLTAQVEEAWTHAGHQRLAEMRTACRDAYKSAVESLVETLGGRSVAAAEATGVVAVNATGCEGAAPQVAEYHAQAIRTPAYGFRCVANTPRSESDAAPGMATMEDDVHLLRNAKLDVVIHPETGGVQAVRHRRVRGNRFSQQLALRDPNLGGDEYSRMVLDRIEPGPASSAFGVITTHGRLVDEADETLATYRQDVRLVAGSSIVEFDVDLRPTRRPAPLAWESYYAARVAWGDADRDVYRSLHGQAVRTERDAFESPTFVLLSSQKKQDAVLTLGLPYTVRRGMRMLDLPLIDAHEEARRFRFALSVDSRQPYAEAAALLCPPLGVPVAEPLTHEKAWMMQIAPAGVVFTGGQSLDFQDGKQWREIRLLETAGEAGPCRIEFAKNPVAANLVDFHGKTLGDVDASEGALRFDLTAYEWSVLHVCWE